MYLNGHVFVFCIVITLLWKRSWLLCFSLVCGLCTVCHSLFSLPLGVISRLWSVIVAIPRHLLCYVTMWSLGLHIKFSLRFFFFLYRNLSMYTSFRVTFFRCTYCLQFIYLYCTLVYLLVGRKEQLQKCTIGCHAQRALLLANRRHYFGVDRLFVLLALKKKVREKSRE